MNRSEDVSFEKFVKKVKQGFRKAAGRKVSDRETADIMKEGLPLLKALVEDPYGQAADKGLDDVVARYMSQALKVVVAAGVVLHPKWPTWCRLLQVRFLQLACADRESLAAVVRKELDDGTRPRPNRFMREVFRQCLIEIIERGRATKADPRLRRLPPLKGMEYYWHEAWMSLNNDMECQNAQGKTIDDAPPEWYSLLGIDYSLKTVPNYNSAREPHNGCHDAAAVF